MNWQTNVPIGGIAVFTSKVFVCSRMYLLKCQEEHHPPGEQLAGHLSEELRRLNAEDPEPVEGDFSWELHPRIRGQTARIAVCAVFDQDEKEPLWAVVISSKLGLVDRLLHRRQTTRELSHINVMRKILANDMQQGRVSSLKWIDADQFARLYGMNPSGW